MNLVTKCVIDTSRRYKECQWKAKGDIALKTIAARLKKEYNVETELFTQGWPHGDEVYDRVIAAECQAAIATTGD